MEKAPIDVPLYGFAGLDDTLLCLGRCNHWRTLVQGLRTLALGEVSRDDEPIDDVYQGTKPLPASLSLLTALSSLALHNTGWEYAPDGLPCIPQVQHM
jgi:hypothetical protein